MRDLRLRRSWEQAHEAERHAAERRLGETISAADRAENICLLVEWWADVLAQNLTTYQLETEKFEQLRRKCSFLPARSQWVGLTAPNTLAREASEGDRSIGALLLGESAAVAVRNGLSCIRLDRAVNVLTDCWEAINVLIDRLTQVPAWPSDLDTLLPATTELAGFLGSRLVRTAGNELLLEGEREARSRGLLAYFWGPQNETVCLNCSMLVRLRLMAARDWQSLARHAEELPLRELRVDLWQHLHLHEDRDAILSLLRTAPPVFAAGEWTGNTSAIAALVAAITHGDQIHAQLTSTYPQPNDFQAQLKLLVEQEIPDWLKVVAETAVARPDGRSLLLLFGASLIREALGSTWNGQRPWSSARHALDAIHGVLTPNPSVDDIRQVARAAGMPINRTDIDHATYLVTSAVFDASASEIWDWYRELLLKGDDNLCWQAKNWRRALCYEALAERLGQLTTPFEEWRVVWNALFVTDREHARFSTLDQNALYPSLHLLRVGAELLRQAPSRLGARQFFEELVTHTNHLITNDIRIGSGFQPELAVDAIDVAPRVLGPNWPHSLDAHCHLLSFAKTRLFIAALLLEGGAPFGEVEAALEAAGRRFADSIAEVKQSHSCDFNVHRYCEIITSAAREWARNRPS